MIEDNNTNWIIYVLSKVRIEPRSSKYYPLGQDDRLGLSFNIYPVMLKI